MARMRQNRKLYRIVMGKLENPRCGKDDIIKTELKNRTGVCELNSSSWGQVQMTGPCEHCNEDSSCIKCKEFPDQLTNWTYSAEFVRHVLSHLCSSSYAGPVLSVLLFSVAGTSTLTNQLTPWSRILPDKLTVAQIFKKYPAFYGTRRFITTFKIARQMPYPEPDLSSPCPHPTCWSCILILSSHLRLGLPSDLFPSGILTKTPYAPLLSPIHATCSAYLNLLNLIFKSEALWSVS